MGADFTFATHTLSGGASAILDMHAAPATTGLLIPSAAGAIPTADGQVAVNTTTHAKSRLQRNDDCRGGGGNWNGNRDNLYESGNYSHQRSGGSYLLLGCERSPI